MKSYIALVVGLVIIAIGTIPIFIGPIFDFMSNETLAVIVIITGCIIAVPAAIQNGRSR